MIYLRTGLPGASKTLNTLTDLVLNNDGTRPIYYHNIKLLMLDYDVCNSFAGWFYGSYLYKLKDQVLLTRLNKIIKRKHDNNDLVELSDVPFLTAIYDAANAFDIWIFWVRRLYTKNQLIEFEELLLNCFDTEYYNFDSFKKLNLHFTYFENPSLWHTLPKQSIILIDEVQQYFPQRPAGSKVPLAISALETHRHGGYDLYLITQDAMLIDVNMRRLVGRHTNYYNGLGGKRLSKVEDSKVFNPSDYFSTQNLDKKIIKHNKNFYGSYHSAEIHTHKFKLPKFVYYFFGILLLLFFSAFVLYNVLFSDDSIDKDIIKKTDISVVNTVPVLKNVAALTVGSPSKVNSDDSVIADYYNKLLKGVYIDGTVWHSKNGGFFDYSFSNRDTKMIFSATDSGLVVSSISRCIAKLSINSYVTFVTCYSFVPMTPKISLDDDSDSSSNPNNLTQSPFAS
ncbi:MAG: zonular occludens toxin [Inoviridae sp.]|nr:MAG: zonular occludens toxin [Inoviridae sp.]